MIKSYQIYEKTRNKSFTTFLTMYVFKLLSVCLLQINVVHSLYRMSFFGGNDKRSYPIFKSFSEAYDLCAPAIENIAIRFLS